LIGIHYIVGAARHFRENAIHEATVRAADFNNREIPLAAAGFT